jgi:hypothetical protein
MSYSTCFAQDVKFIIVSFTCNKCGYKVESDEIRIPLLNYKDEEKSDGLAVCKRCFKDYDIDVYVRLNDGEIKIHGVDESTISYEQILDENVFKDYMDEQIDAIVNNVDYIKQFKKEIENLRKLNSVKLDNIDLQKILQKQIFSGSITCLEDYLSSTLIKEVLSNENNFKNFVYTYENFKKRKFELNEIYSELNLLEDTIKKELLDIIYHDLRKVRGIYQDSLKIKFPEIRDLMSIITKRHDIVHRNGKDKNGKIIEISEEIVEDVLNKVSFFIGQLEDNIELKMIEDISF